MADGMRNDALDERLRAADEKNHDMIRTPTSLSAPAADGTSFRELVEAIRDCASRILHGNDEGHIWTTTLQAHATVISQDFDCFGQPIPELPAASAGEELPVPLMTPEHVLAFNFVIDEGDTQRKSQHLLRESREVIRSLSEQKTKLVSVEEQTFDPKTHVAIPRETPFGLRSVRVEVAQRAKEVRSYLVGPVGKSIADALDWVVKDLDGWLGRDK